MGGRAISTASAQAVINEQYAEYLCDERRDTRLSAQALNEATQIAQKLHNKQELEERYGAIAAEVFMAAVKIGLQIAAQCSGGGEQSDPLENQGAQQDQTRMVNEG